MISVRNLSKSFGAVAAVEDASLDVGEADRLAVVGPSAGGKTTLLRLIAGLEEPDAGEVVINGMLASRRGFVAAPHTRSIGMVFQRPALWPHMTVAANIGFGLDDSRSAAVDARIEQLLAALELEGLENRRPHELSGGQAQRVALARALAPGPRILLLDEPFQNLDDELAGSILDRVHGLLAHQDTTVVYVSHHEERARRLCPLVAVLRRGRIESTGRWPDPEESR